MTDAMLNVRNNEKFKVDCGIPGTKWLIRFELAGWNDLYWSSQDSIDELNFERHRIL